MVELSIKINPQGNSMLKNIYETTFFSKPQEMIHHCISANNPDYFPLQGA